MLTGNKMFDCSKKMLYNSMRCWTAMTSPTFQILILGGVDDIKATGFAIYGEFGTKNIKFRMNTH